MKFKKKLCSCHISFKTRAYTDLLLRYRSKKYVSLQNFSVESSLKVATWLTESEVRENTEIVFFIWIGLN